MGVRLPITDSFDLQFSVFYFEHVFTKDPGTNRATPWHHDQAYFPVDGWKASEYEVQHNGCSKSFRSLDMMKYMNTMY